jgi:hypothetical protein
VNWGDLKVGDVINIKGGYPFLLVRKDGYVWTWVNLSDGESFEIEYQTSELSDPHEPEDDFLQSREKT